MSDRHKDYIGAPLRNDSLPHPSLLRKWLDDGLLKIDTEFDRLIAGPKHKEAAE